MSPQYGMLAGALARARSGEEDIRRKKKQDDDADVMKQLQQAALLANLEDQGIVPSEQQELTTATIPSYGTKGGSVRPTRSVEVPDAERYKPLGSTGYVQDQTRTKRAQSIAAQREKQQATARRVSTLRALVPELRDAPDEALQAIAEDEKAFQDRVQFREPPKPEKLDAVNWQTVEGKGGFYQVNPRTGEKRALNIQAPVKEPGARATVPTEGERRAAGMARRLKAVSPVLNRFDNRKTLDEIASRAGMLGNWASSAEGRQLRAAGKIWATAVLRPESGATITEEELDAYFEMYLPRPGDDDATLEFKRQQRKIAEESVSIDMAGRAATGDAAASGVPDHTTMSDEEFAKAYRAGAFKKPGIPK